jgi:CheY-like chemotaxis protein
MAGRRIVVVDDNVGAAMLLSKLLGMLGDHEVVTAHDGMAALEAIRNTRPDIVLLDIGLPGMNGYEVAKAIREHPEWNDVLLVALTGYGQKEDRRKSQEAGFDEHRVKPPSIEQMKEILRHPKLKQPVRPPAKRPGSLRETRRSRSASGSGQDDLTQFAPDELSKVRHDLGNVAHVLSMISELYLQPGTDPELLRQAKAAVDLEVGTLKSLIERLRTGIPSEKA